MWKKLTFVWNRTTLLRVVGRNILGTLWCFDAKDWIGVSNRVETSAKERTFSLTIVTKHHRLVFFFSNIGFCFNLKEIDKPSGIRS